MHIPVWFLSAWLASALAELVLEPPLPQDGDHALPVLCLTVAVCLSFYGLASVVDMVSRKAGRPRNPLLRGMLLLRPALPLICFGCLLWFGRWDAFVRFHSGDHGLLFASMLTIAPYLGFELIAILGELLLSGRADDALERLRATWLVVPIILALFGWLSLLDLSVTLRAALQELAVARYIAWALGFAIVLALFPSWFTTLFRAKRLEPAELRDELLGFAKRVGVSIADICELETGGRALNAAVLGSFRRLRRVVLTDVLVDRFTPRQLRAVFAHELGHAKRHHVVRQLVVFLLLPLVFAGLIAPLLPWELEPSWLLVYAVELIALLPLFRWMRHQFEYEADAFGAELTSTDDMLSALHGVASVYPGSETRASLMHPSLDKRIAFLEQVGSDAALRRSRFRARRLVETVCVVALFAGAAWFVPRLVVETGRDLPAFDLARGEARSAYEAWLGRLSKNGVDQEDLREQLDQASRAMLVDYDDGSGPPSVETMRQRAMHRARKALVAGDRAAVLGWVSVAQRWGESGEAIAAVYSWLDAEERGDDEARERAEMILRSIELPADIRKAVTAMLDHSPGY